MVEIVQGTESRRVMLRIAMDRYLVLRPGRVRHGGGNMPGDIEGAGLSTVPFDEANLTDEEMAMVAAHVLVNGD